MYCEGYLNKFALTDLHLVMPNEIQAFSSYSIVLLGTGRGGHKISHICQVCIYTMVY